MNQSSMASVCLLLLWALLFLTSYAQGASETEVSPIASPAVSANGWRYGAYLDIGGIVNFNVPENDLWRSRTTASRHNQAAPNMVLAYVRKDPMEASRWGMELGVQGGYDSVEFAFLPGEKKVDGADVLRHLHRANASYLAPVGNGLTVTAGLFNSLMGYESLYAKDNMNYTRSWIADNTPYMMFGVNAAYPVNDRLTVTTFIINRYYHLAYTVAQPSYGGKWSYALTPRLTAMQTLYWGPDQTDASLEFWRLYGNHILEWKGDEVTVAVSYDAGTENIADQRGSPRAFVMGGNLMVKWHVTGPWSVVLRPEFYWDRNGRWTGAEQFVKAITSTIEYKLPYRWTNTMVRVEHRYDESTGVGGGFFRRGEISPGIFGLAPSQHLLVFGLLCVFDSP
ncbi:MAG: outer membrane beta-barrel protein [Nitrospira sp.]|nr:outer membrane beta-barrel protein [Nitrospira sp.]MBH0182942.1 outer membrane beta-barrel protein [Nitrospira sp.]